MWADAQQSGRPLPWTMSPLELLMGWPKQQQAVMLHSGRYHPRWSRYSLLATPIETLTYQHVSENKPSPFDWLDAIAQSNDLHVGMISYDIGRHIEHYDRSRDGKQQAFEDRDWPLMQWHRCPRFLLHDAAQPFGQQWFACGDWSQTELDEYIDTVPSEPPDDPIGTSFPVSNIHPDDYQHRIQQAKDYIAAGDIFQVNLTHRLTAQLESATDPRHIYHALAITSPAWFGCYFESPWKDSNTRRTIASISPELFLEVDAAGHVVTRPIKGTRPTNTGEQLIASDKDAAELNMIIDLMRNDLGRVCDYGSVKVTQHRTIEPHPTVHHGVATIEGDLHPSRSLIDLLKATLPGGSITGAPKVRAMQIIDELETNRRGPYTGCLGWIKGQSCTLNIAIRTALIQQQSDNSGHLDFGIGGGIVADSIPADEYQETLDKAAALFQALQQPSASTS